MNYIFSKKLKLIPEQLKFDKKDYSLIKDQFYEGCESVLEHLMMEDFSQFSLPDHKEVPLGKNFTQHSKKNFRCVLINLVIILS